MAELGPYLADPTTAAAAAREPAADAGQGLGKRQSDSTAAETTAVARTQQEQEQKHEEEEQEEQKEEEERQQEQRDDARTAALNEMLTLRRAVDGLEARLPLRHRYQTCPHLGGE